MCKCVFHLALLGAPTFATLACSGGDSGSEQSNTTATTSGAGGGITSSGGGPGTTTTDAGGSVSTGGGVNAQGSISAGGAVNTANTGSTEAAVSTGGATVSGTGGSTGVGGNQAMGGSTAAGGGGNLTVVSVDPTARTVLAPRNASIVVTFDRAVDEASVTAESFWAFGRWSGPLRDGQYSFSEDGMSVTLAPPRAFTSGDRVTVVLSHDLQGTDGSNLRSEGYSFQFSTATLAAPLQFSEHERHTTLSADNTGTRAYGGSAADLNADGFLDLMVVNEDSADLRIYLNTADGLGSFHPFAEENIVPLRDRASPSETTDFNADGVVDLVVANLNDNSLSILFGNGQGSLSESQVIRVGEQPRGVAVLDVDGDGDVDIVNTNANGDNMSLLINDGAGNFGGDADVIYFDSGHGQVEARSEFGLFSGDMNEDGILDLVIGARGVGGEGAGVVVNLGLGDGSFGFGSIAGPDTSGWQLAVGDLNGDGHEDVATADGALTNDSPDTATMLLGDGGGNLSVHQIYDDDALNRPFAIDLGDLDGDGDLDTVVSNYNADWEILVNDGSGQMSLQQSVAASQAASCALLIDIDNDADLDLALIDEEEDEVIFLKQ